eukprot:507721-Prorocentrum_minimum.AAC.1
MMCAEWPFWPSTPGLAAKRAARSYARAYLHEGEAARGHVRHAAHTPTEVVARVHVCSVTREQPHHVHMTLVRASSPEFE